MRKIFLFGLLTFLIAFNAACTPETPLPPTPSPVTIPGVDIQLAPPFNGAVLSVAPVPVTVNVSSSICCVNHINLVVNGHSAFSQAFTGSINFASHVFSWTPATTGEYFLQGQVTLSSGAIALTPVTRVCVLNFTGPAYLPVTGGYLGPCAIPTRIPSAASSGMPTLSAIFSPQTITILPVSCGGNPHPTFTINATVSDPADQVFLVIGFVTISGELDTFFLNWYSSEPGDVKLFHGTFTPRLSLAGLSSITWSASAFNRRGAQVAGTLSQTLPVQQGACPHEESATTAPLQIIPSATPGNLIANVQAYPAPIYYGNTCPSVSDLSFRAALVLPPGMDPKQLQVLAHASIDGSDGSPAGSLSVPLMPNGTFDTASGGSVFLGTLDLSHAYKDASNQFDPASLGGSNGSLHWYITVANQNTEMGRSSEQTLNLAPCPTSGQPASNGSSGSSGNATCPLSIAACEKLGENFDPTKCSCYIP